MFYQTTNFALYRTQHDLILAACGLKQEHIYYLDDYPAVIRTVISILGRTDFDSLKMSVNLQITDAEGRDHGELMHYIISAVFRIPVDTIKAMKIKFLHPDQGGEMSYRIANACFPGFVGHAMEGPLVISRVGNDIVLYRTDRDSTTITDYTAGMIHALNTYPINQTGRGGRETVCVDKEHRYLLYQLRYAECMYHYLPEDKDELIRLMDRFAIDTNGLTVDHLDEDARNNRVKNLMLMTKSQNTTKEIISRRAKKLDKHCWYKADRYDDNRVHFLTGFVGMDGKARIKSSAVLDVPAYIEAFRGYVDKCAEQNMKG